MGSRVIFRCSPVLGVRIGSLLCVLAFLHSAPLTHNVGDAVFITSHWVESSYFISRSFIPRLRAGGASLRSTPRLTLVILSVVTLSFVVHVHAGRTEMSVDSSTLLSTTSAEGCALTNLRKAHKYKNTAGEEGVRIHDCER